MAWQDIIKTKKPDFLDLDGDGNKTEPMSDAAQNVKKETGDEDLKYLASLNPQERKKVLEARKNVSQGIPSDAPTTERIPQWKQKLHKEEVDLDQITKEIKDWLENYDWSSWRFGGIGKQPSIRMKRGSIMHKNGRIIYSAGSKKMVLGHLSEDKKFKIGRYGFGASIYEKEMRMLYSDMKEAHLI